MVFFISKIAKSKLITRQEAMTCMSIVKPALSTMNNQLQNDALWAIKNLIDFKDDDFMDAVITGDVLAKVCACMEPQEDYSIRLPAL